jgi:hypothetical protein
MTSLSVALLSLLIPMSPGLGAATPPRHTAVERGTLPGSAGSLGVSPLTLQQSYGIPGRTTVLAAMVGWFGSPKHMDVGYRSDDPRQVARQLESMQARGIGGVTIAWYGSEDHDVSGRTAAIIQHQAEQMRDFTFALRVNEGLLRWYAKGQDPTTALIQQLQQAQNFFRSPAYLRRAERPVIFFFGFESFGIHWEQVQAAIPGNSILLFRNSIGFDTPASGGAFAWGPANDLTYLQHFYQVAARHPAQVAVGGLHKGFDDAAASWTQHRKVDQRCGQTFLDTVGVLPRALDYVQLVTWDDYEEGTELETGIDNCVRMDLHETPSGLQWKSTGNESAVDHYEIQVSRDGGEFSTTARVDARQHSYTGPVSGTVRIVAVGKAMFLNQASNALELRH